MQVVHARCCGLDVHKKSVVACVLLTEPDGSVRRQVRTFGTMTAGCPPGGMLALDDWLSGHGVTQVTMESTGVYWRPVFNLLEHEERTITSSMRNTSRRCRGTRRMSRTASGSPIYCVTDW